MAQAEQYSVVHTLKSDVYVCVFLYVVVVVVVVCVFFLLRYLIPPFFHQQ